MKAQVIGFAVILFVGIVIAYNMLSKEKELAVINPVQLNDSLVEPHLQNVMSGHRIGSFQLTNQHNQVFTEAEVEGKIYVADFFFTTCPGICKAMANQMVRVQEANKDQSDFMILSHTVQPEVDLPEELLSYGKLYGADFKIWQFLTGDRSVINSLARQSYFAAKLEEGKEDEMVHTENFVLIDKEKRIRGIYDGTSEEEVDKLIEDINVLRRSYE